MYIRVLVSIWVLIIVASCSKEQDKENPKIQFIYPLQNDSITLYNDSLPISFKITDNKEVRQYSYTLKDSSNNKYLTGGNFVGGQLISYSDSARISGFSGYKKLTLYVTAYDATYNAATDTRVVYVQP